MKPIKRKTTNTVFKRPDCYDLPGTRYKYEDETPAIETCWELNDIELEKSRKQEKYTFNRKDKHLHQWQFQQIVC